MKHICGGKDTPPDGSGLTWSTHYHFAYENKMRCDNWSLMYFSSRSHDTISTASFKGENTHRQSSPEAFLMHLHFEVKEMTPRDALWSEVKSSLISAPTNDLLRGKNGGGGRKGKGQTKDREGQTHSQHIFSSLQVRGGADHSITDCLHRLIFLPVRAHSGSVLVRVLLMDLISC